MTETSIKNKSLSIRLCTNGLSFCSYTPADENPFVYKEHDMNHTISMTANLKEALANEPMLKDSYQRINVMVSTPHFTTLPVAAFQKDDIKKVYETMFPADEPQHVSYNVLRRSGIALVFGLERNIHQLLVDDFPRARFYASASTLIEFFAEKSQIGTNSKMFVYQHEKEITIYAYSQGRMVYVNTFPVQGINDCQYYTLGVWKQLGFDQINDALSIVGDSDNSNEFAEKIRYFLQNVNVINRSQDFRNSITAGNTFIPYDLQTLLVCGF